MSSAATQETASTDPILVSPKPPKARSPGRRPLQRGVRRRSLLPESRSSARPAPKLPAADHDWTSKTTVPKPSRSSARSRRRTTAGDARRWSAGSVACFRFGILRQPCNSDGGKERQMVAGIARHRPRWLSKPLTEARGGRAKVTVARAAEQTRNPAFTCTLRPDPLNAEHRCRRQRDLEPSETRQLL